MEKLKQSKQFPNHYIKGSGGRLIDHGYYYTYKGKDHLW